MLKGGWSKPFPFNTLFLLIPRFFADKWRQSRARSHSTFRFAKWIALEIAKRLRLLDATFLSFFLDWSTRDSQSRVLHFEIHLHRLCFATRSVFQSLSLFNFWIFEFFSHLRTPQIFHLLIFEVFSNFQLFAYKSSDFPLHKIWHKSIIA